MVPVVERDSGFEVGPSLASLSFRIEGHLDISRIEELDRAVAPALSADGVRFFLDITDVTFMDSIALGWLLRTQEQLQRRNGCLRIVAAGNSGLPRLLALTGLEDQIEIFATISEAEQGFDQHAV